MQRLEGDKTFPQSRQLVYTKLTDLQFLVKCLPDLHEVKEVKEKTVSAILRPGFAFVRGEMHLTVEKLEETNWSAARYVLKTKGIGSSSEVETTFKLSDQGTATLVRWTVEVKQLGGLLKATPSGLIQGAAQRVVTDLLTNIERKLSLQI
jgi:carbon monoxide dehydrogenase subunit G